MTTSRKVERGDMGQVWKVGLFHEGEFRRHMWGLTGQRNESAKLGCAASEEDWKASLKDIKLKEYMGKGEEAQPAPKPATD